MKKQIYIALICLPFLSMAQTVDRTKSPAPGKAPLIQVASPVKFTLANGLQVFVVKNTKLPKVTATLALDESEVMNIWNIHQSLSKKKF